MNYESEEHLVINNSCPCRDTTRWGLAILLYRLGSIVIHTIPHLTLPMGLRIEKTCHRAKGKKLNPQKYKVPPSNIKKPWDL